MIFWGNILTFNIDNFVIFLNLCFPILSGILCTNFPIWENTYVFALPWIIYTFMTESSAHNRKHSDKIDWVKKWKIFARPVHNHSLHLGCFRACYNWKLRPNAFRPAPFSARRAKSLSNKRSIRLPPPNLASSSSRGGGARGGGTLVG